MPDILDKTQTTTVSQTDSAIYVVNSRTTSPVDRWETPGDFHKNRTGNESVLVHGTISAAVTAIGSSQATLEIPATTTVSASLTIPNNITTYVTGPGQISVASGQILTINGPIIAPPRQIFTGTGSVHFGNRVGVAYAEWFGQVGDNSTDDTAAIQKAIDAFSGSSFRGGIVRVCGASVITSTLTVTQSSLFIEGPGWGFYSGTGLRGFLRWNGSAGSPMILFDNTIHSGVRNLRIIGKSTAKPTAAIEFRDSGGGGINDQNITEGLWIGTDISGEPDTATGFDAGIIFTGLVNGDSGYHEDIHCHNCGIGIDIQNPNAGVQHFDNLVSVNCTRGIKANAPQILVTNWNCGNNDVDLELTRQGMTVQLINYTSEGSGRIVLGSATSPMRLVIDGGGFQCDGSSAKYQSADITGKRFITKFFGSSAANGLWLEIRNFDITQVNSPLTPIIQCWNTADGITQSGGTSVHLRLEGVTGISTNNINVGSDGFATSSRIVEFSNQPASGGSPHPQTARFIGGTDAEDQALRDEVFYVGGLLTAYGGPIKVKQLAIGATGLSLTPIGGASTSYSYKITALTHDGESLPSTAVTTAVGPTTLDSTHFNQLSWWPVPGARAYRIYGRTAGSELLIKTLPVADIQNQFVFWNDDGALTPSGALPTRNSTGNMQVAGIFSAGKGADVASAATITPTGNIFHVTGTTTITSVSGTDIPAGTVITIIFDGILTFTDGSNLVLAGNFVTSADDTITLQYDGTNWYELCRSVN